MLAALALSAVLAAPNVQSGVGQIPLHRCSPVRCVSRRTYRRWRRYARPHRAWLRSTRYCESGNHGLYRANTGNSFYGAYQFTLSTWRHTGGRGYPHEATPAEQDYRAAWLMVNEGAGHWPICGRA